MVSSQSHNMQGWFSWICEEDFDLGAPCTGKSIIDLINTVFLITYTLCLLILCLRRQYTSSSNRHREWTPFISSLCCALTGISYLTAGLRTLILKEHKSMNWKWFSCFIRSLVWIVLSVSLIIQPMKLVQKVSLAWWTSFPLLFSAYNVNLLLRHHQNLQILEMLSWPVSLLLLFYSIKLIVRRELHGGEHDLCQPLLSRKSSRKPGFFSLLSFSWLNPLLKLGYSKPLRLNDIPPLYPEDTAQQAYDRFFQVWSAERHSKGKATNLVSSSLFKCYSTELLVTGFYALLKAVTVSASPILLYAFVWYNNLKERELKIGLTLVGLLVAMKLVESLSQRHWFFESRRLGMKMRSALMAAVFEKMLKLSCHGRKRHSAGEVVNYIAVDAYRLGDFPCWFHMAWSLPLQLLLAVGIIFWAVGLGALPGLVPLTILGFANVPFAKFLQDCQAKFMVAQDDRLRATSEALNNMKIIKLQSWEHHFRSMIESLRDVEFEWLSEIQNKKAYGSALYWMSPTVVSTVILAGTAAMGTAPLDASTIFTVLATLRVMSEPMRMLPEVLSMMIQAKVSLDRINTFLLEDEIKEEDVMKNQAQDSSLGIQVRNGSFRWEPDESVPTLKNLNLSINRGEKIAVCGPVGSGKSSLLYAILGEIPKLSGSVEVFGSIAYVSQTSWIQSGTIRDNILYGKPMDRALYDKAIKCSALDKDMDNFDHGDLTEIGQRGLNMSGGQKQRIQLARAVYNDADIYLLDDPFSAVDAHTAAILFHDCVMLALKHKTVILVTHQVEFLTETDRILVMENGRVAQEGTYEELLKAGAAFGKLVNAHQSSIDKLGSLKLENQARAEYTNGDQEIITIQPSKQDSEVEISTKGFSAVQLTEEEETEIGDLGWKPYHDYLQVSKGYSLFVLMILLQLTFMIFHSLSSYWLAVVVQVQHLSKGILIGVYSFFSILSCFFAYSRNLVAAKHGLKASKAFFTSFMDSIFAAPMLFFDSTPVGRILTRASSDLSILDFDIPYSIAFVIAGSIDLITIIVIMASVTWQVVIVAIPVLIIMVFAQRYYVASARELVRINGTTKAPVMNSAAESLLGAVTIRAFGMIDRFIRTNLRLIDTDASLFYYTVGTLEWVLLRVEALQNLTIFTSSLFLVMLPPTVISPGFSGLCLSYALSLSSCQVFLTRFYSNLENYVISVERIKQFMHITPEPSAIIKDRRPPPTWPSEGRIDLQELKVRYHPNAPLVLKGITCAFKAGNKIGVVGRTGSGKTTLISSLFRLVDPSSGKILIDELDICSIGLKDLRMKLSIIPQEATLFRGSIRSNLDPLGLYTDQEIWEALEKCQLKTAISSLPTLLDSAVNDDGQNWSAGQRQLFCLGRVLLCKNRILVLDEATASIDSATDAVLQRVIREEFSNCTVITIAHRVPTVVDSDMVMVLSYGKMVEYDEPSRLIENQSSAFSKLVAEYWSNCRRDSSHSLSSH
ncbi:ABC transporter C family member 8-like isoform X1 [Curcuma longa]|uniref:ABC transporter C family member 8-like isoform X1 n=1 Tax=Curcuma longa TaxID=136217 RepID=UPI003D9F8722